MGEPIIVMEKKKHMSRGCKHRFVNPIYKYFDRKDDFVLKCAWCKQVFETVAELEAEYTRLHVPFKRKSVDDLDKPNQTDFMICRGLNQQYSNTMHYSSFRWGFRQ